MSEEIKNQNEQTTAETQAKKKPVLPDLNMISKGTLELAVPLRAKSQDVTQLHYDFTKLTGWEYAEAMDCDTNARNVFNITKKQALCLFASAAAKATPDVDATDIKQRIGIADAQRAVQVATLFLTTSAQVAGKNTYGE